MTTLKIIPVTNPDISNFELADRRYGFWYLHGDLESLCRYDIGYFYEFPEESKETLDWKVLNMDVTEVTEFIPVKASYLQGIYPVEVYGIEEKCVGYFWITEERDILAKNTKTGEERAFKIWTQRGLVCLESDVQGNKDAKKKYIEKYEFL